jgi:hypothetical protein
MFYSLMLKRNRQLNSNDCPGWTGFQCTVPFNAFTTVRCNVACRERRIEGSYREPRSALKLNFNGPYSSKQGRTCFRGMVNPVFRRVAVVTVTLTGTCVHYSKDFGFDNRTLTRTLKPPPQKKEL